MKLSIKTESWPIKGHFSISRSSLTDVELVLVEILDGQVIGRGECRPYSRYNETAQSVIEQIEHIRREIESGLSVKELQKLLPAGAARNAVDCALWDLRCKTEGRSVWDIIGQVKPAPKDTAFTLSCDTPSAMAKAAVQASMFNILKLKVDAQRITEQIEAVAKVRPKSRFIIDANEDLKAADVYTLAAHVNAPQIALIEQPLHDNIVRNHSFHDYTGPPLCADESFHGIENLEPLKALGYKAVNIKLDKCGGFTAAMHLISEAKKHGFMTMSGCMLSTSLSVAPMAVIMDMFDIIDLDGGALLERDRAYGLKYEKGKVHPPLANLWG